MLSRIKRLFDTGPRDPTAVGFNFCPRLTLGYPFIFLAVCGFGVVALIAGLAPRLPRIVLFAPYAASVALLGSGLLLGLFDPRDVCKWQLQEFWH